MTTVIDAARDRILEDLHRYERGTAKAPLLRSFGFVDKSSDSSEPMQFIASTEDEDRAGDVIRQDGWKLARFRQNPVYLFSHNYSLPPIGTVPRIWVESKQLRNIVKFDLNDPLAQSIESKFRSGVMNAQSVGFRPLAYTHLDDGGIEFTEAELLEISAVTVPMNQAALRLRSFTAGTARGGFGSATDPFERLARRLAAHTSGRRVDRHSIASDDGRLTAFGAATIRSAIRRAFP